MINRQLTIHYQIFKELSELDPGDKKLCEKAEQALASSYSPYSNFQVGTAVLLDDGNVVLGSNQENVAYPSGLCAERVALFSIGANHKEAIIKKMAITAHTKKFEIKNPITSCGACLQVMAEFEQKQQAAIEVLFYCLNGEIIKVDSIKSLLPFVFVEDRLGGK